MTTTFEALATLSRHVAARFHRLFNRLTRKAELTLAITVAIPPFFKMEAHYKKDFGMKAHDKYLRPRRGRHA